MGKTVTRCQFRLSWVKGVRMAFTDDVLTYQDVRCPVGRCLREICMTPSTGGDRNGGWYLFQVKGPCSYDCRRRGSVRDDSRRGGRPGFVVVSDKESVSTWLETLDGAVRLWSMYRRCSRASSEWRCTGGCVYSGVQCIKPRDLCTRCTYVT